MSAILPGIARRFRRTGDGMVEVQALKSGDGVLGRVCEAPWVIAVEHWCLTPREPESVGVLRYRVSFGEAGGVGAIALLADGRMVIACPWRFDIQVALGLCAVGSTYRSDAGLRLAWLRDDEDAEERCDAMVEEEGLFEGGARSCPSVPIEDIVRAVFDLAERYGRAALTLEAGSDTAHDVLAHLGRRVALVEWTARQAICLGRGGWVYSWSL